MQTYTLASLGVVLGKWLLTPSQARSAAGRSKRQMPDASRTSVKATQLLLFGEPPCALAPRVGLRTEKRVRVTRYPGNGRVQLITATENVQQPLGFYAF